MMRAWHMAHTEAGNDLQCNAFTESKRKELHVSENVRDYSVPGRSSIFIIINFVLLSRHIVMALIAFVCDR